MFQGVLIEPVTSTDALLYVLKRIEEELKPVLTPLQSRVFAMRVLIGRLGEVDAWGLWNSRIWTQSMLFQPIFPATWQRERVLLAMAAASAAAASDPTLANQSLLFNLSFDFDATLSRSLKLLSVEIYARICAIIDAVPWNDVLTLRSLEELEPMIDNNYPGVSDSIVKIGKKLANLTRKR